MNHSLDNFIHYFSNTNIQILLKGKFMVINEKLIGHNSNWILIKKLIFFDRPVKDNFLNDSRNRISLSLSLYSLLILSAFIKHYRNSLFLGL